MKPFPATARAGSALALLALSGCYYGLRRQVLASLRYRW